MRLLGWLFRRGNDTSEPEQKDADLVDAQERLGRLETKSEDADRRQRRAQMELDARRRHP